VIAAWEEALGASGLPLSMSEGATPRPRISFAAPAPLGMLAEGELIDVMLSQRRRIDEVRAAVTAAAPAGYRCVDLHDVWTGAPSLPSLVVAGDYRATMEAEDGRTVEASAVEAAATALLAAPRIEVHRSKGAGEVAVDIRPHIRALRVLAQGGAAPAHGGRSTSGGASMPGGGGSIELWMRLRLGGEGGVGRPEEVIGALGERLGRRLVVGRLTRVRIVLADEADPGGETGTGRP
jgi:radical SAM-linked protein